MRTFLTSLVFLSFFFAAISVAVLFAEGAASRDILVAVASCLIAVILVVIRHFVLIRFGRLGLLKPTLFWKPLSKKTFKSAVAGSTASTILTLLGEENMRRASGVDQTNRLDMLIHREMRKIRALGYDHKLRTGEELISENKLHRFIQASFTDRSAPPLAELRGVRDTAVFFDLRQKVDDWYARRDASRAAFQSWRDEVGDENRDHLLKKGWIPFLQSLDGPDIYLWHGIATDFHEIEVRSRLDAAFWILEQPECDKATTSEFIVQFIEYKLEARDTSPETLERFADVVRRYNADWFAFHSIKVENGPKAFFQGENVADVMQKMGARAFEHLEDPDARAAAQARLAALPIPVGLLEPENAPVDPPKRHVSSGFAFWDDAGLHLSYPGDNWRAAG